MHTVRPVTGFEAQELTTSGVAISMGGIAPPSSPTRATPVSVVGAYQAPLGTYAVTLRPCVSTDNALDAPHRAVSGCGSAPTPEAPAAAVVPSLPPHPPNARRTARATAARRACDK